MQIGTLRVSLNVAGAAVWVDGRAVETSAGELVFVDPGSHTIEARVAGSPPARKTVRTQAGSTEEVRCLLINTCHRVDGKRK